MKRETDQYMMFTVLQLHLNLEIVGVVALLRSLYAMLLVILTKLLKFKRNNGKIEI